MSLIDHLQNISPLHAKLTEIYFHRQTKKETVFYIIFSHENVNLITSCVVCVLFLPNVVV